MLATDARTERAPNNIWRITKPPEGGWTPHLDLHLVRSDEAETTLQALAESPQFNGKEVRLFLGMEVGLQFFDKANHRVVIDSPCYDNRYVVFSRPRPSKSE